MTKEKKKILNYRDNTISNKLKKFPKKVNNNSKKYEPFNVVSETGDSIYAPMNEQYHDDDYENHRSLIIRNGDSVDQVFISENTIKEIVNRIIDQKRLGTSLKNDLDEND